MLALRVPQGRGYSKARLRGACSLAGLPASLCQNLSMAALLQKKFMVIFAMILQN
jgi:hypothetical protein